MTTAPISEPDTEVLDFLLTSPTPAQIIALRPSEAMQSRLADLLDGNRNNILNNSERAELDRLIQLEQFMRRLKIRAHEKLNTVR